MEEILVKKLEDKEILELINSNFKEWNDALKTGDSDVVANLYDPVFGTLHPTLSNETRVGKEQIKDYFEREFLPKHPDGKITDLDFDFSGDSYLMSGLYDFEVGPEESRHIVHGRFTYYYKKNNQGVWQIRHHHSSLQPDPTPSSN